MHTSKSVKSKESKMSSDISLPILPFEIWPNHLCHNDVEFSLFNLRLVPHDSTCKVSWYDAIISSKYRLSYAHNEPVPKIFEFNERLN